ncbi:MAG: hypothetical protein ACOY0T_04165 [Myxococcota bacterium]
MNLQVQNAAPNEGSLNHLELPRASVRVLAACARSRLLCVDLGFVDCLAEKIFEELGGDAISFGDAELRGSAFRASVLDLLAIDFFSRNGEGLGIGLWPVLGTRAHRLDVPWVDIDSPEIARLRRYLMPHRRAWSQIGTRATEERCLEAVARRRGRLLFVLDEATSLGGDAMAHLLDEVSRCAPAGSELLVSYDASAPLRPTSPLQHGSSTEIVLRQRDHTATLARYPRLRFFDEREYSSELRTRVAGVNAIARFNAGIGAPALAHLRVI